MAAAKAFLTVTTQWRMVALPNGKLLATGLDYAGAKSGLKLAGIKPNAVLWAELRMIEQGARSTMNED
ncbi:MAG: DUF1799 domain-containing protein [Amylibacter sp.]|nr:DUF1799 domain-containing protein [Amylibacter sp.]